MVQKSLDVVVKQERHLGCSCTKQLSMYNCHFNFSPEIVIYLGTFIKVMNYGRLSGHLTNTRHREIRARQSFLRCTFALLSSVHVHSKKDQCLVVLLLVNEL